MRAREVTMYLSSCLSVKICFDVAWELQEGRFIHVHHVHLCNVAVQLIHHEGEGGEVGNLEHGWGAKELAIEGQHECKG